MLADTAMGPDMRWVMVRPPGAATAITLVTWIPSMPPGSVKGLVLEAPDLDAEVARLADRGVVIGGGIQNEPWGRYVQLEDPDGNGLIIQTTLSQAPPESAG